MVGLKTDVGVIGANLMVRRGRGNFDAASALPQVSPMNFSGSPIEGFVYIASIVLETETALATWVEHCTAFARSLPAK